MVKKEELRIGNLVIYKGEVCRVSILSENGSIGVTDHMNANTVVSGKELEPIEVTKEMLLQNGFVETFASEEKVVCAKEENNQMIIIDIDLHFTEVDDNPRKNRVVLDENKRTYTDKGFRYVHELQNALYPDLELKLNIQPCPWKN